MVETFDVNAWFETENELSLELIQIEQKPTPEFRELIGQPIITFVRQLLRLSAHALVLPLP
jgi:hypothetical protein